VPSPFTRTTRSLAHDSVRWSLIALAAAAVGLIAWTGWFFLSGVTVFEVSRQARLESGAAPREVAAAQSGRLATASLAVGRPVRAGDVLVEFDAASDVLRAGEEAARLSAYPAKTEALRREIAALEAADIDDQRAAQAGIQSAKARVREAAGAADFAADNARRQRTQASAGGVAEIEALRAAADAGKAASVRDALAADARKTELDALTRSRQAQAQIEDLKRTLASLDSDAAASRSAASRLTLEIENRTVRAPVDGVIAEALPLKAGAYVAEGQKLATIVPSGGLIIVAQFNPASALGRVKPGQRARLRLDGFPWTQFGSIDARVVGVAGEIRDGGLRVELAASPSPAQAAMLRHGLTGQVDIGIESVSPALLLLRAAGQAVSGAAPPPASPAAGH
jgi:adhesin transport system membrane fusion protein